MADANDMLSGLLSDPEKMSQIMSLASSFMGGGQPESPPSSSEEIKEEGEEKGEPVKPKEKEDDFEFDMLGKALPFVTSLLKGAGGAVSKEKKDLISAISPFLAEDVAGQMKRGVKLLGIAKMVKGAINGLGSTGIKG